jgi:integrase
MKGHIRERPKGSGNWYAVIDVRDPATGRRKRKWHSLEAKGKRQAEIECATLVSSIKAGTYLEPNKTTLAHFIERWLENTRANVAPRTHERYAEIARKSIAPLIGAVILSQLKPAQISEAYTKALRGGRRDGKGGLSPQTVIHMHRVLKQALKQAVQWEMIHRNPADAVRPPKVEKHRLTTYDMSQTAALLEAVQGQRIYIPVLLAALCGLRRGEIAALRWCNVDLEKGSIAVVESVEQMNGSTRLKETKSGRVRAVSLPLTVRDALRAHRLAQAESMLKLGVRLTDDSFVCALEDGTSMQPTFITHEWLRAIKGTNLPQYRFHDLRHAHATHMLTSGTHVKVASERLGHSRVGITLDLYSHVLPGMQEDAAAKVDAALRAAQNLKQRDPRS